MAGSIRAREIAASRTSEFETGMFSQRFSIFSAYLRPEPARSPDIACEIDLQSRRRTVSSSSSKPFIMTLSPRLLLLLLVLMQIRSNSFNCFDPFDLTFGGINSLLFCSSRSFGSHFSTRMNVVKTLFEPLSLSWWIGALSSSIDIDMGKRRRDELVSW